MDFHHPMLATVDMTGPALDSNSRVVIVLGGAGGNQEVPAAWADSAVPDSVTILAPDPRTRGKTRAWWATDKSMMMNPRDDEYLESLNMLDELVEYVMDHDIPAEHIAIIGQSQGAVLALEYGVLAQHHRFAIVMGMSGGLLAASPLARMLYRGSFPIADADLKGRKFALSVHDRDPKVPLFFVKATERMLRKAGADVSLRVDGGRSHRLMFDDKKVLRQALGA